MLRVDLEQLDAHEEWLEDACRELDSAGGRGRPMLARARRAVAEEVAQEGAAVVVGEFVAAAVPFVGIAVRLAAMGVKGHQARRQDQARIAASSVPGESADSDIVDEAVALLRDVCRRGLPVVVFVEDLDKADVMLLELLDKLLRVEGPIMVISTTWPDNIDTDNRLVELLESHRDRLHRVGHTADAGEPFPRGAGLTELDEQARQQIVRSYYPEIGPDVLQALTDRYHNPHAVETACQLLKRRHPGPCPDIGPNYVTDRLPMGISDLYLAIWNEIPEKTRVALAVAHAITPANISGTKVSGTNVSGLEVWRAGGENRWAEAVLHDVINSLGLLDRAGVLNELANAPHAYAWVRVIDDYLRSFAESVQSDIVENEGPGLLVEELDTLDAREQILNALAEALTAGLEDHPDTINRARTILVLHAEGYLSAPAVVAHAINAILRDLQDAPRELPERVHLYQLYRTLNPNPVPTQTQFAIRQYGALALGEAGRADEAITVCKDLLPEQMQALGAEHSDTLFTRHILAGRLGEAGRIAEAITVYEQVLADRLRVLGPDDPHTLTTRHNLAGWNGAAGRIAEAITVYEQVLADRLRVLGPDHPHTLTTRHNVAHWLGKAGRIAEAITVYEQVSVDRSRVLGPDHPHALETRNNLARWLGEAGRVEEAITAFEGVLDDRLRVLGPDNPHTLLTRHNLAHLLGRAGRVEEAITAFEGVLDDRLRVLGPDNPHTLLTRHNLAHLLGRAGRVEEAITAFEGVLDDRLRVLGPDSPHTLSTRNYLAHLLGRAGRVGDAITALEGVLDDRLRVLGPEALDTLFTRHVLAGWLGEVGRVGDAITASEELLEDRIRVSGSDDPDTLDTRHNLAHWLARAGRVGDAITVFEELLEDRLRVLGADHPHTLPTRRDLAYWRGEAQRADRPITASEEVLADPLSMLGSDHSDRLSTRHGLAGWLGRAGRAE